MSLYLGSEKVENVTAQITLPVEPSDDLPLADGTASAGVSKKFSRADHVHPAQEIPVQSVNGKTGAVSLTASDVGAISSTLAGTAGQVLTKTANGQEWKDAPIDESNVLLKNVDVTMPTNTAWRSICYGDGKFVAVAGDYNFTTSTAAYSTDGITWIQTTLPASTVWYSVCYGDGKFVAVAWNSSIAAYSTDGINWSQAAMPVSEKWYSVCYCNDRFVAVAYNSSVAAYSFNGVNWTRVTLPASAYWGSICYGNGKFVAVAQDSSIAAYSTNSVNWTQATLPSQNNWMSVTYGGGKFVAVAEEEIAYSVDGINWVLKDSPIQGQLTCITYGDGKFVATIDNSAYAIYSTNGVKWEISRVTPDSIHQLWCSVTYGKGKFVAIADSSDIIVYSTDGINWLSTAKVLQYPDGTDIHEQVRNTLQIPEPESELFTVTISGYDGNFTSNKTGIEIQRAYNAGKICVAIVRSSDPMFAIQVFESEATFVSSLNYDGTMEIYRIIYDGTVQYTKDSINPKARKVTLTTSGWSNNQQTVTCSGVFSTPTSQEIRVMPVDASKTSAYVSCGVSCVAQASDKLTFACDKVPTTAIDVYVVMQSLNFQN